MINGVLKIKIDDIYFDLNKADIRADAAQELDKIVEVVTEVRQRAKHGSYLLPGVDARHERRHHGEPASAATAAGSRGNSARPATSEPKGLQSGSAGGKQPPAAKEAALC